MKRFLLILSLILVHVHVLEAKSLQAIVDEKKCTYIVCVNGFNNSSTITYIYYTPGNIQPSIGYNGTGYKTLCSNYEEKENRICIDTIYLWTGTEISDETEERELLYYQIVLDKNKIMDSLKKSTKNFIVKEVSLLYSPLVFKAVDLKSSVFDESFHVKEQCFVYDTFKRDKKEICNLNPEFEFEILGITEDNNSRVFLKIKRNELLGYVPLDKVSNDWTVIKNKLDTFVDVNNIPAFCNDDRVKLRKEPSLDCETLGYLNKGDKMFLKDHSDKKTVIDNKSFYWYKVELPDGKSGWVYGKYLDIEE